MMRVTFDLDSDVVIMRIGGGYCEARARKGRVLLCGYFPGQAFLEISPEQLETWAAALRTVAAKASAQGSPLTKDELIRRQKDLNEYNRDTAEQQFYDAQDGLEGEIK